MTAHDTKIMDLNRFDPSAPSDRLGERLKRMLARRFATFGGNSILFYKRPVEMVSAKGAWMFDAEGKKYLDLYNNVPCVGHGNERVAEALFRQALTLNTNTRYLYDNIHTYAERLLATCPAPLSNVVFTCSGSESNDLALQIVRAATGGSGFIVTENAYHGNTSAVHELSPSSCKGRRPPPHVRLVPPPESHRSGDGDPAGTLASNMERAIEDFKKNNIKFAGALLDSIFASDGILGGPAGLLKPALDVIHRHGGLLIIDEVQPGFGRAGKGHWNFARHGIVPDLVTMGKPMGNGFPIGGVATRPDLLEKFNRETAYFNTFGGSTLAAAAGLAVLDELEAERMIENADRQGEYLMGRLRELARTHTRIGDVRGAGLFIGVEFSKPGTREPDRESVTRLVNDLKEQGVLIGASGPFANVMRVRPPLCLSRDDADYFIGKLKTALEGMAPG
ncbi:MAG: aminotransferase class III-fold pyridoxal phosphate-dependent enzyme [Opitutaceae bacterium]|jgi:4-aminobutyrate aminotransferase-like enzyme|nr:aminotransferase class III-fold pyridoxal phosphate-dependent enzyme [Opitutaceae bacterium]